MSKDKEKPAKKFPAQVALNVTRAEMLMLWQLINQKHVAVHPSEGAVAGMLHAKMKGAAEAVGIATATPDGPA